MSIDIYRDVLVPPHLRTPHPDKLFIKAYVVQRSRFLYNFLQVSIMRQYMYYLNIVRNIEIFR